MTRTQTPSARADLHLRALQAALSATLALGLGACADTPTAGGPGGGALTGADSGAVADDTGPGEDSGVDGVDSGGATADTGGAAGEATCADVPPEALADCCLDLQADCTLRFPDDFDAAYDCAFGPASGCTPWGPPVPPELA